MCIVHGDGGNPSEQEQDGDERTATHGMKARDFFSFCAKIFVDAGSREPPRPAGTGRILEASPK